MGVFTYEIEIASVIPPAKLFKAFALDDITPKLAPQSFKSNEMIEGDGGPGTIKKITFGEGSQLKYVKYRIDKVDHANFSFGYSAIEGDGLSDILEKISHDITLVASPDGGCISKIIGKYHTKGDHEINEEQIKTGKEKASQLFYVIESYLLAHPDVYNI